MNKLKLKNLGISISLVIVLTGCNVFGPKPNDPAYAPVPPEQLKPPINLSGSIYQEGYAMSLFEDKRARRVGDILTITLEEAYASEKEAVTTLSKNTDATMANPTIMNSTPQFKVPGILPLADNENNNLNTSYDMQRGFDSDASSEQSNSLTGSISVTVASVMPNGNLVVRGEKWLTLNRGDEFIRITGIVRPDDINTDNTVSSTRVADARITYSGKGEVADSNAVGWLAKFFFTALWPL